MIEATSERRYLDSHFPSGEDQRDLWLPGLNQESGASLRVFAIPFAGGDVSAFYQWYRWLPKEWELIRVQLPARGRRRNEHMPETMESMVGSLASAMVGALDKPYAIVGYSMGALIAYELLLHFKRLGLPKPKLFCIAACSPPHLKHYQWNAMSDSEILQTLMHSDRWLRDVSAEQLENNLKLIKQDLFFCQEYTCTFQPAFNQLNCPVITVSGRQDTIAPAEGALHWRQYISASCIARVVEGGHFFLFDLMLLPNLLLRELQFYRSNSPYSITNLLTN